MDGDSMDLLKNLSHPLARRKEWKINLSQIGDYQHLEITDPSSELSSIYLSLIEFVFQGCPIMLLSQFIDESQGMLSDRDKVLAELSAQYGVKTAISKDYGSIVQPSARSREYVLNMVGKPEPEWLNKVLVYGGASLSNIMYGVQAVESDWLDPLVRSNHTFTIWYWLEVGDEELIQLRKEVKVLCWTSDTHINMVVEANRVKEIISYIEEIAEKYGLNTLCPFER